MRKFAFKAAAVMALASSTQLAAAQTQSPSCLTRPELRGMISYILPTVLKSTIDTCTGQLKADSYILTRAPKLLNTLESGRSAAWPMARAAFAKFGDDKDKDLGKLFASLPEESVRPLIEAVIDEKIGKQIKPSSCTDIDRIMAPLDPLPPANLIEAITETFAVAAKNDKQMQVCRDS